MRMPWRLSFHTKVLCFCERVIVRCAFVVSHDNVTRRIRIVCISDTHKKHRQLDVPDGDILIHAGDFSQWGMDRSKDVTVREVVSLSILVLYRVA